MNAETNPPVQIPYGPLADRLYVPDHRRYVVVRQSEILYVKAARSSVELFLADGSRRVVSTYLSRFITYLNDALFVQVSRSFVVNLLFVHSVQPGSINVNNQTIMVTQAYRDRISQRLTFVRLRSETDTGGSS